MQATRNPPALADAADVLSSQLREHLQHLAKFLLPHAGILERRFLLKLRRLRFDAKQRTALAAITPFAASGILAPGRPLSDFFEQVEYNGRRLAKLALPPSRIVEALRESDGLLKPVFGALPEREGADLRWVVEQLHFCVVLTLNNSFYQVRETETQTYQELFHAELESQTLDELLRRMIETLRRFCRAETAVVYLLNDAGTEWQRRGVVGANVTAGDQAPVKNTRPRFLRLTKARCVTETAAMERVALDPAWSGRYGSCWSIPLAIRGRTAGVMQFGFGNFYQWLPREVELLRAAAERCLLAAEKASLAGQLAAREKQVRRLAGHMMQVEERERKRISSELHDEAGQSLVCLRLQMEILERSVPEQFGELKSGLAEARALAERSIVEIRRLIGDLSPAVLEQLGLPSAMRQLASRLRRLQGIKTHLQVPPMRDLPKDLARVVYRLTQECINNIARHSSASSVNILVTLADGQLRLRVEDNGVGFSVEEILGKPNSYGLAGMRERVALFGGKFTLESRPGRGTKVLMELPVPEREQP